MAKTVVKPCNTPDDVRHPKGEHLSRVAYDDNEPPKNYVWCKPDGTYWKWNGVRWMKVLDFAEDCPHFPPPPPNNGPINPVPPQPSCNGGSITFEQLNNRLEAFRVDLYAQILEYFDTNGGGTDIGSINQYFNDYIEPRIRALEQAQSTYDDTTLISRITSVDNRVTAITSRVSNLENTRVTRDELNTAMSNVANSSAITSLSSRISTLEQNVGNLDLSGFITAEEVNDISSITL